MLAKLHPSSLFTTKSNFSMNTFYIVSQKNQQARQKCRKYIKVYMSHCTPEAL